MVAWAEHAPLDACRRSEARIKKETLKRRAPDPPWEFAFNRNRTRRGRLAFSGETELRLAATDEDVAMLVMRYAVILAEECARGASTDHEKHSE